MKCCLIHKMKNNQPIFKQKISHKFHKFNIGTDERTVALFRQQSIHSLNVCVYTGTHTYAHSPQPAHKYHT